MIIIMPKKTKAPKVSKKEETSLHMEVVLLDDVFQVLLSKVIQAMDILRDSAFCEECSKKKTK